MGRFVRTTTIKSLDSRGTIARLFGRLPEVATIAWPSGRAALLVLDFRLSWLRINQLIVTAGDRRKKTLQDRLVYECGVWQGSLTAHGMATRPWKTLSRAAFESAMLNGLHASPARLTGEAELCCGEGAEGESPPWHRDILFESLLYDDIGPSLFSACVYVVALRRHRR